MQNENAGLIIGGLSGQHAEKLGQEMQANRPASDSMHAYAKYLQEIIAGNMTPQEAAIRTKLEQQAQPQQMPQVQGPLSQSVPGTNGVSVSASEQNATPRIQSQRMGPLTQSVHVPPAQKAQPSFGQMTNRDAAGIVPGLSDLAKSRIGHQNNRDYLKEIEARGNEARKTETVKQTGKKEIAEFNADAAMERVGARNQARMNELLVALEQRGEEFERTIGFKYYALSKTLALGEKKLEVIREGTDSRAMVQAFSELQENAQRAQQQAIEIRKTLDWDDEEQVKLFNIMTAKAKILEDQLAEQRERMKRFVSNGQPDTSKTTVEDVDTSEIETGTGRGTNKEEKSETPKGGTLRNAFKLRK
jgi:hypothetical protein